MIVVRRRRDAGVLALDAGVLALVLYYGMYR